MCSTLIAAVLSTSVSGSTDGWGIGWPFNSGGNVGSSSGGDPFNEPSLGMQFPDCALESSVQGQHGYMKGGSSIIYDDMNYGWRQMYCRGGNEVSFGLYGDGSKAPPAHKTTQLGAGLQMIFPGCIIAKDAYMVKMTGFTMTVRGDHEWSADKQQFCYCLGGDALYCGSDERATMAMVASAQNGGGVGGTKKLGASGPVSFSTMSGIVPGSNGGNGNLGASMQGLFLSHMPPITSPHATFPPTSSGSATRVNSDWCFAAWATSSPYYYPPGTVVDFTNPPNDICRKQICENGQWWDRVTCTLRDQDDCWSQCSGSTWGPNCDYWCYETSPYPPYQVGNNNNQLGASPNDVAIVPRHASASSSGVLGQGPHWETPAGMQGLFLSQAPPITSPHATYPPTSSGSVTRVSNDWCFAAWATSSPYYYPSGTTVDFTNPPNDICRIQICENGQWWDRYTCTLRDRDSCWSQCSGSTWGPNCDYWCYETSAYPPYQGHN